MTEDDLTGRAIRSYRYRTGWHTSLPAARRNNPSSHRAKPRANELEVPLRSSLLMRAKSPGQNPRPGKGGFHSDVPTPEGPRFFLPYPQARARGRLSKSRHLGWRGGCPASPTSPWQTSAGAACKVPAPTAGQPLSSPAAGTTGVWSLKRRGWLRHFLRLRPSDSCERALNKLGFSPLLLPNSGNHDDDGDYGV